MTGSRNCFIIALALGLASVAPTLARTNQTRTRADQAAEVTEAFTLSQQAVKLYNAGKYKDALPRAQRALEIREKALGKEDILVGRALANLAAIYFALRQYSEAQTQYEKALHISEKAFGATSPNLCDTLENLAWTYYAHSDNRNAESLFKRSLSINQSSVGMGSLRAAKSAAALAAFYGKTGAYGKSADLYKYSVETYQKSTGYSQDELTKLMGSCMCALVEAGHPREAEGMYSARYQVEGRVSGQGGEVSQPGEVLQGKAIKRVEPAYPNQAKVQRLSGAVIVEVTIDESGKVVNAVSVCGPELLEDAAVTAARQWRFQPLTSGGVPVRVIGTVTFNFKM
ncbi:MAG: TonB family protein [Blastocatellia bacterium]